jgi:hypothetical protein
MAIDANITANHRLYYHDFSPYKTLLFEPVPKSVIATTLLPMELALVVFQAKALQNYILFGR